jgi:hypothetical protein
MFKGHLQCTWDSQGNRGTCHGGKGPLRQSIEIDTVEILVGVSREISDIFILCSRPKQIERRIEASYLNSRGIQSRMECPENVPSVSHSGCSVDDDQSHVSPHHITKTAKKSHRVIVPYLVSWDSPGVMMQVCIHRTTS